MLKERWTSPALRRLWGHSKPAIVVYGKQLGRKLTVCTDKHCPVHDPEAAAEAAANPAPTIAPAPEAETEEEAAERQREFEQRREEHEEERQRREQERKQQFEREQAENEAERNRREAKRLQDEKDRSDARFTLALKAQEAGITGARNVQFALHMLEQEVQSMDEAQVKALDESKFFAALGEQLPNLRGAAQRLRYRLVSVQRRTLELRLPDACHDIRRFRLLRSGQRLFRAPARAGADSSCRRACDAHRHDFAVERASNRDDLARRSQPHRRRAPCA